MATTQRSSPPGRCGKRCSPESGIANHVSTFSPALASRPSVPKCGHGRRISSAESFSRLFDIREVVRLRPARLYRTGLRRTSILRPGQGSVPDDGIRARCKEGPDGPAEEEERNLRRLDDVEQHAHGTGALSFVHEDSVYQDTCSGPQDPWISCRTLIHTSRPGREAMSERGFCHLAGG